ncbi:MAG: hypothetical protein ABIE25_04000 [Thermoplasmatota archaeon]|nr:hypothetical protein [Candidatus Thermoplasmatota archaeon]MBU1915276.1 hypothetical protein [Candidatus Thermoplasmatota archaeon]
MYFGDHWVGFDKTDAHRWSALFQRLRSDEDFPGTGIDDGTAMGAELKANKDLRKSPKKETINAFFISRATMSMSDEQR